jgi:hypothetical protein
MVKLNKIGKYSSILINDFPRRRRTTTRTTKQNLDPRCMYVPTRVKITNESKVVQKKIYIYIYIVYIYILFFLGGGALGQAVHQDVSKKRPKPPSNDGHPICRQLLERNRASRFEASRNLFQKNYQVTKSRRNLKLWLL